MNIQELRKDNALIDLFCTLAEIPSPSLGEDKVITEIISTLKANGIDVKQDDYSNVIARIPATDPSKKPLLLSAHMDVVGDDSPVHIVLTDNEIIETDKSRTLGADDKAGVTAAIATACRIVKNKKLKHGGLEIVFTRDEEGTMSGVRHVDFKELEAEYVLVLDSDTLGEVMISGAGYTTVTIDVTSFKDGHSGNDIGDSSRVNAAKLLAEIVSEIPQGVYKQDEEGVITSINLGVILGGGVDFPLQKMCRMDLKNGEHFGYLIQNAVTNVINKKGSAKYSLRSSDEQSEADLLSYIQIIVDKFNKKYKGLAKFEMTATVKTPKFEKNNDTTIPDIARKIGKKTGVDVAVASFHAGAETHIYSNEKNKFGKIFKPYLIGVATIKNMHSADEQMYYKTLMKGADFVYDIFTEFNK
ncbi:MAG: M20/M25/M40 family metallo-hydrolase [Candidatus Gastranaerophilales bacterium]|nr:M20/M25/M40 family metallo-hydrolase [Candidatus Gastranaerophilales bacterium]